MNEHFFKRVKDLIKLRGSNEKRASEAAFRNRNALKNALLADSAIGIDFADGLARHLDVSLHYLITGMGDAGSYIPSDFHEPTDANAVNVAVEEARAFNKPEAAIQWVLRQEPDPRLGVGRILALIDRAEAGLQPKKSRRAKVPKKSPRRAALRPARSG